MRFTPVLAGLAAGFFAPTYSMASSMIEVGTEQLPAGYSVNEIVENPFFQSHLSEIQDQAKARIDQSEDLDETIKTALKAEVDELPFHRILDIEIVPITGFPDTLAVCLEGNPVIGIRVEGCAGVTLFVASLSANLKYRFDYTWKTKHGKFRQLGVGPGAGVRRLEACLMGYCESTWMTDFMASLEYVGWITQHLGITLQLDAGVAVRFGDDSLPMGRLSVGVAF